MNSTFFHILLASVLVLSAQTAQPQTVGNPKLTEITVTNYDSLVNQHKGKVVLANFWATWCKPCMEEFPDLVRIARTYSQDTLVVLLLSMDVPEVVEKSVLPFLRKQNVDFETYIKFPGKDSKFIDLVDAQWGGAIPHTVIYDRSGVRRFSLSGKQTFETFQASVRRLF